MSKMDHKAIKKLAKMARLFLSDEDIARYEDIEEVLTFVEQIKAVDTTDVSPMTHTIDLVQILREDKVTESNQLDALEDMAPKKMEAGLYTVPHVFSEEK
jgi:aspartyl-tRNA(Asn)/glutamyl-tRNA(Gln) amidotransferase subunit C